MNIDNLLALAPHSLSTLELSRHDSLGTFVTAACLLEATSVKAGNVHPHASFVDMNYEHFRQSAKVIGIEIDKLFLSSDIPSVGSCVYEMVRSTKQHVGINTNLGTILLLGPLLVASRDLGPEVPLRCESLRQSVKRVLRKLDALDSQAIYKSIKLCNPGGIGKSEKMDTQGEAPARILDAMNLARERDDVAKQWVTDFEDIFRLANRLSDRVGLNSRITDSDWLQAIANLQVEYLSANVDSLITRKNGNEVALEVKRRANALHQLLGPGVHLSPEYETRWQEFDSFLRADSHRRNPGTTADLLAAAIFIQLFCEAR